MEEKKIITFKNLHGNPMIRRCLNCKHWSPEIKIENKEKEYGYCKLSVLMYAFTLENSVYAITKSFYLCENHEFAKESEYNRLCEKMEQSASTIKRLPN